MVLPPKITDTQPDKGIGISPPILSSQPLTGWQGSITTFKGFTGTRPEKEVIDAPWAEIKSIIKPDKPLLNIDKKSCTYFLPCGLKEAQLVGKTLEKAEQRGETTVGKMRSKSHVTEARMVIFDLDGLSKEVFLAGLEKPKADGITYVAYTTHSHGKTDKPGMRVRLIILVDDPLNKKDYASAWHAFNQRYFNGEADASGASLYQQQGTWCSNSFRVDKAESWENTAGVASTDALLAPAPEVTKAKSNNYPPSDANKVADHCNQIGQFLENKGAGQPEPLWRDCMGVVGHCDDGEALVQSWSCRHEGYNSSETAAKLSKRLEFPPTTCTQFKATNPDGCNGCIQTCRSPIKLGMEKQGDDSEASAPEPETQKNKGQLIFDEVEPYPKPIDPIKLFIAIAVLLRRYIVIDAEQADAVALWIVLTWVTDHVGVLPLLIISAPEKACGKSQLLDLVGRMSYRPLPASNVSTAAMFRSVDAWQPTLLIDEADTFFSDKPELSGIINAGHTRASAYVIRSAGEEHTPKSFSVWSAKAIAGIDLERHLKDATMSRGIIINMRRKMPNESVERIRHADGSIFGEIQSKLARFAVDYGSQISEARPILPDELDDRQQDNWEPLLAIAECAGPECVERGTKSALKLSITESAVSIANQLLTDIQYVFASKKVDKISSAELIEELSEDDEMPWATYNRGRQITPRQIASHLKKYDIKSKTVRFQHQTLKGYDIEQFQDAFARYLTPGLPKRCNDSPEAMKGMVSSVSDEPKQSGNVSETDEIDFDEPLY